MQVGLIHFLIVGLGGALGGMARFWVSGVVARWVGETFPWGTLVVNVSGSFTIGLLATLLPSDGDAQLWLVLVVGILGSYTTVSSFSLQTLALVRDGEWLHAGLNILASVVLCLGAAVGGFLSGHALGIPR